MTVFSFALSPNLSFFYVSRISIYLYVFILVHHVLAITADLSPSLTDPVNNTANNESSSQSPPSYSILTVKPKVWIASIVSILVISVVGLVGVAVVPLVQKVFYNHVTQFLVALAIGTLTGDAMLHLLPHAIVASLFHGKDKHQHDERATVWKGLVALGGVYIFFIAEKLVVLITEYRAELKAEKEEHAHKLKYGNQDGGGSITGGGGGGSGGGGGGGNTYSSLDGEGGGGGLIRPSTPPQEATGASCQWLYNNPGGKNYLDSSEPMVYIGISGQAMRKLDNMKGRWTESEMNLPGHSENHPLVGGAGDIIELEFGDDSVGGAGCGENCDETVALKNLSQHSSSPSPKSRKISNITKPLGGGPGGGIQGNNMDMIAVTAVPTIGYHNNDVIINQPERKISSVKNGGHSHGGGHGHGHSHEVPESMKAVMWMVILGDGLHNFSDGLAIGAAFAQSISGGVSTAVAVFFHELPHELGDFAALLAAGMEVKKAIMYNILSSVLCFLGMLGGIALGNVESFSYWIFAVAGGTFIYISLVDMLPELSSVKRRPGESRVFHFVLHNVGIVLGVGIMLVIALFEDRIKELLDWEKNT